MTTQVQILDCKFMVQKVDVDTPGYIKGIATTPTPDSYDDIIATGAFQKSINDRGVSGPKAIKMLAQHDSRYPIGNWKTLVYQGDALHVEGIIDLANEKGVEYYNYLKKDQLGSLSVGFTTKVRSYDEETYTRTILIGDLREISLVTFPANEDAVITQVKMMLGDDKTKLSDIEKIIARDYGLTRNKSSQLIRAIRSVGLVASAPTPPADVGALHTETKDAIELLTQMSKDIEMKSVLEEIEKVTNFLRA